MTKKLFLLLVILFISFLFNFVNNDFPLGYHVDEVKKVTFIAENRQDFKHPILLLQIPRFINIFLALKTPESITHLGRTLSALYGVGIVLLTYLISKRFLKGLWALLPPLITSCSPLLVIHAHYIKEDVLLALCLLLTTWRALIYSEKKHLRDLLLFAFFLGLTISSKYMGAIFLPLAFFLLTRTEKRPDLLKKLSLFLLVVVSVFLLINFPLLSHFSTFEKGLSSEIKHAIEGHCHRGIFLPIYADEYLLGFHIIYSLVPGFTLFFTGAAFIGMGLSLAEGKKLTLTSKIVLITPLFFYLMTELSPLKCFPDYMRYVIPVVPFLALFSTFAWQKICKRWSFLHLVFIAALLYMATDSALLVYYLTRDTRAEALIWMETHKGQYQGDQYALVTRGLPCVSTLCLQKQKEAGVHYLLTSSFFYDRISFAAGLRHKADIILSCKNNFDRLFDLPYTEIKPAYKSFAFSNPTIRIVDIRTECP